MKTFLIIFAVATSFLCGAVQAAAPEKELVILAESTGGTLQPLYKDFEQQHGVKVRVVSQGKNELLSVIPSTQADVVLTSVGDELEVAKRSGHLLPVTAKLDYSKIPQRFRDPDGYWTGYAYRVRSIFYNADKVGQSEISLYGELADPRFRGRVCSRTLNHKYNLAFISWMVAKNGVENTRSWISGVRENLAVAPSDGDKAQAVKITKSLCDVSITNSYYMGELLIDPETRKAATSLGIKLPQQQDGGAYALVNSVAILKQSKDVKLANAFVQYLESHMSQQWIADVVTQFPVRSDIVLKGFVGQYGKSAGVVVPKIEGTSISDAVDHRAQAVKLIAEVGF